MLDFPPKIVTRFIGYKRHFNKHKGIVYAGAFDTPDNRLKREISVSNIGDLLRKNNLKKIYQIGDRIYKKPPTPARADLKFEDIETVIFNHNKLYLDFNLFKRHCNIKPFPSDEALSLAVSQKLAQISTLHVRNS